ncbi:MAG: hypothetical protein IPH13_13560 [Planctomycetes bacterium]|nr:hypothetical protein [Planctomycetota bacterium]MCC7171784.1 hypothetical protein [Planctomycetota bacterium]
MDARKVKFDAAALKDVFGGGKTLIAGKGKKFATFDLTAKSVDWRAIEDAVLGPSGTLRAPTIRVGSTFYVGFSPEAWADVQ